MAGNPVDAAVTMTRRERVRQATLKEIRSIARKLLVAEGVNAVTVNAVARAMGMSGPALYRYYGSQGELIEALTADFYCELIGTMRAAGEDRRADTPGRRLLAISRALRGWAIAHPAEFAWLFASRIPASRIARCVPQTEGSGRAFGQVFMDQIVEIWQLQRFPVPSLEDMAPSLAEQLRDYSQKIGGRLPPEAAYIFLTCWMRLYGLLCMEVLNQISFAFSDLEPVYEECLQELCRLLDVPYEPPC
jgi:AcrR family transcriptional regulator